MKSNIIARCDGRGHSPGVESADVIAHERFEPTQAESARFGQRMFLRPTVVHHAIAGDQNSGTVRATPAVHEHRHSRGILHDHLGHVNRAAA
jgi:hypothetical protein